MFGTNKHIQCWFCKIIWGTFCKPFQDRRIIEDLSHVCNHSKQRWKEPRTAAREAASSAHGADASTEHGVATKDVVADYSLPKEADVASVNENTVTENQAAEGRTQTVLHDPSNEIENATI